MTAPQPYAFNFDVFCDTTTSELCGSDNTVKAFISGESDRALLTEDAQDERMPYHIPGDQRIVHPALTSEMADSCAPSNIGSDCSVITVPSSTFLSSTDCYKLAFVYPSAQFIEQSSDVADQMTVDNASYALHLSSLHLFEEPLKPSSDLPLALSDDLPQVADKVVDNDAFEDYSQWLLQHASVTDFGNSCDDRKLGRMRKSDKLKRQRSFYSACDDESFPRQQNSYRPDNFWCPLCRFMYSSSVCPHHPIIEYADTVVPSFARLSKPNCIQLVERTGITRAVIIKRQPALTRFGPLVAPSLSEAELAANPHLLAECPFRLEIFDPETGTPSIRYLRLGNEAVCNWMMFVRLIHRSSEQLDSCRDLPNAVAYQQGSDGIFFLTTRQLRSGQELLVTYAPPYAARFGFPQSVVGIDILTEISGSGGVDEASSHAINTSSASNKPPDEIHCFMCSLTFTSEDAFRVHCLGHPGEMDQRGIHSNTKNVTLFTSASGPSDCETETAFTSTVIEVHRPQQNMRAKSKASVGKTAYFQSVLRCSLCAIEVEGLSALVQHTNSQHSMLKPRVFKWEASRSKTPMAADLRSDLYWNQVQSVNAVPTNEIPLSDHVAEGLVVVDLGRVSRRLNNSSICAYGCGQCYQRFPDLHALEQHKDVMHNVSAVPVRQNVAEDEVLRTPCDPTINHTAEIPEVTKDAACFPIAIDSTTGNSDLTQSNIIEIPAPMSTVSSSTTFECCVCGHEVRTRSALSVHMRKHNCHLDKLPTTSSKRAMSRLPTLCSSATSSQAPNKRGRMFFHCRVCGEGQPNQLALRQHGLKHQRPSDLLFPCLLCPKESNRAHKTFEQLQRHIRFVHPSQIFPCPYCNSTFGRRKNLNNHLVHHTGRRDFSCPHSGCHKVYSRKDKLKEHLRTHEDHSSHPV